MVRAALAQFSGDESKEINVQKPPPEPGARAATPSPSAQPAQTRPGVPPQDAWTCPLTHPIKGNFTTYSGERCIYHGPGGQFYNRTKPERCYVTGGGSGKGRVQAVEAVAGTALT